MRSRRRFRLAALLSAQRVLLSSPFVRLRLLDRWLVAFALLSPLDAFLGRSRVVHLVHWRPAELQEAVVAEGKEDVGGEEEMAKPGVADSAAQDTPWTATERIGGLSNVLRFLSSLSLLIVPAPCLSCQLISCGVASWPLTHPVAER